MMAHVLHRYEEKLMGLPYPVILLDAAEEITHPKTDKVLGVAVPDAEELAAAVAFALCFMPTRLSGAEVRFIRRVMGMTGQELAAAVGMGPATLSRGEHGKQTVGGWADKAVRMAAVLRLRDRAPGSRLRPEDIVSLQFAPRDADSHPTIEVRRVQSAGFDAEPEVKSWDAEILLAA